MGRARRHSLRKYCSRRDGACPALDCGGNPSFDFVLKGLGFSRAARARQIHGFSHCGPLSPQSPARHRTLNQTLEFSFRRPQYPRTAEPKPVCEAGGAFRLNRCPREPFFRVALTRMSDFCHRLKIPIREINVTVTSRVAAGRKRRSSHRDTGGEERNRKSRPSSINYLSLISWQRAHAGLFLRPPRSPAPLQKYTIQIYEIISGLGKCRAQEGANVQASNHCRTP